MDSRSARARRLQHSPRASSLPFAAARSCAPVMDESSFRPIWPIDCSRCGTRQDRYGCSNQSPTRLLRSIGSDRIDSTARRSPTCRAAPRPPSLSPGPGWIAFEGHACAARIPIRGSVPVRRVLLFFRRKETATHKLFLPTASSTDRLQHPQVTGWLAGNDRGKAKARSEAK
jgi:hypothetical protein